MTATTHSSRLFVRTLAGSASLMILALAGSPAFAAEPAAQQDAEPAAAAAQDDGVAPIIVTATRRSELAKDVPIAVTSIGGEKLDTINSSGLDIRFLSSRTPSLQIESSFGRTFPRFYIRGLGNTDFDINAAQPVSVVYNDVALENPLLKSFPVFDVDTVQVLRGPQGTLFGRNTPAGVVKIDSVKPRSTLGGYASASYASLDTVNAEAALNVPLGDGFAVRVSGIFQHRGNWIQNTASSAASNDRLEGYTDVAGRLLFGYSSADFNAVFDVHGRDLGGTPRVFRAGILQQGTNQLDPNFRPDRVALDGYTSQSLSQYGINLRLDYTFEGIGTLYSVTAFEHANVESTGDIYGGNRSTGFGNPAFGLNNAMFPSSTGGTSTPQEFSQEVRFQSVEFNGLRLQGGVYYFHQVLRYAEFAYDCVPVGASCVYSGSRATDNSGFTFQDIRHDNRNDNFGLFGAVEYKPVEDLTLRAGIRYSTDHKNDLVSGTAPPFALSDTLPTRLKVSDSQVTWDVSATYAVSPLVNIYGRVATGYLGTAISDRVLFGSQQLQQPKQTTISAEGGIKGGTADRKLNFSISGYWNRTANLQLTQVGGSGNTARLLSADHVLGYGVELEVEARPVPQLALTASGSYNYTEIQSPGLAVSPCDSACTVLDPIVGGLAVIDGNRLPQAPRFVGNVTARYGIPVGDHSEIYFYTDWAYRSSVNFFLYEAVEFRGRPTIEGGLKLGYKVNDKLDLSVFTRNVTNQIRAVGAIDFNNLTGFINEPRIVGGAIRFGF